MVVRYPLMTGAGLCLLAAPAALAQLWTTGPWDTLDGQASDRPSLPVRPERRAADDFILPVGNGLLYDITGLSGRVLARNYSGAFAEIFADNAGVPAAAPSYTLSASGLQVLQTGIFGQYDLIDVTIDPASLALTPGTWWVSIVCNVSGEAAPADGYGFFCTAGNAVVQGSQGYSRVDGGAWQPAQQSLGFPSDYSFTVLGAQRIPQPPPCYPNCDGSTIVPILNINDFLCFLNRFASGESYANCDNSTTPPVLNINDFLCFLNRFASGCT